MSILLIRCDLIVSLLFFLCIFFNLLLHWYILPIKFRSRCVSFCCQLISGLWIRAVSSGAPGIARRFCAFHRRRVEVSREEEKTFVVKDLRHVGTLWQSLITAPFRLEGSGACLLSEEQGTYQRRVWAATKQHDAEAGGLTTHLSVELAYVQKGWGFKVFLIRSMTGLQYNVPGRMMKEIKKEGWPFQRHGTNWTGGGHFCTLKLTCSYVSASMDMMNTTRTSCL